jgi:hypothetical protein
MKFKQHKNAWCVARPKDAALLFDKVHILEGALLQNHQEVEDLRQHGAVSVKDILVKVEPGVFIVAPVMSPVLRAGVESLLNSVGEQFPSAPITVHADDPSRPALEALWVHVLAVQVGVSGPGTFVLPEQSLSDDSVVDPALTISGLSLIDTSRMDWRQILEMRRDKQSIRKLRRLRLFMQEKYDGKDLEFVREDIHQRIEDYNEVAKTWGATVGEGALTMLLGKEVRYSLAAALAATLAGMPQASLVAAVPFLAKLGEVCIELRGKRRDFGLKLATNPVAFLCEVMRAGGEPESGHRRAAT